MTYKLHIFVAYSAFSEVQLHPLESVATVTEGDDAMVCIGVSNGSLQRDILLAVKIISGPTSTGEINYIISIILTAICMKSASNELLYTGTFSSKNFPDNKTSVHYKSSEFANYVATSNEEDLITIIYLYSCEGCVSNNQKILHVH